MSPKIKKQQQTQRQDILWFKDISFADVPLVGGKNASLGEMYSRLKDQGIAVPNGFAITADAYWYILEQQGLRKKIKELLQEIDVHNVKKLAAVGKKIRQLMLSAILPKDLEKNILDAYHRLGGTAVAVRSSATAEDLPTASFAGQQESFLNIEGDAALLLAVKRCMASLFTDRAISYREAKGFGHLHVALSVTVQQMIRASASGVLFTVDTESGFDNVAVINGSYGLGEYVVKGRVIPDQWYVVKAPSAEVGPAIISKTCGSKEVQLVCTGTGRTKQKIVSATDRARLSMSDSDILQLTAWGIQIEKHYARPQDIEWVKQEKTGKLFIVQARPETVISQQSGAVLEQYVLKKTGKELLRGIAVGRRIGAGKVRCIEQPSDMALFKKGEVLVTRLTDPDWEPIMRMASAIITEQGGKTSHAAIVSREIGVPCIVGAKDARSLLKHKASLTIDCSKGEEGIIYQGVLPFEVQRTNITDIPKTKTQIMMNIGDPQHAFSLSGLPHDGIGLARLEFIFTQYIRIHPLALTNYHLLKNKNVKKQIDNLTKGYKKKTDYFVDKLSEGIARIAASAKGKPVIVRLSDFKSNEYASLLGGKEFEPQEENPMLGWRGASRYYSPEYKPAFALECRAIKRVREEWGLKNIIVMVPFCRTPEEGEKVLQTMAEFGLKRGENGLQVYVMCEIPSNVMLAEEFAALFDGFSIGTNDLAQLTLGLDRDAGDLMHIGDATNQAVKKLIKQVIDVAHKHHKHVGVCGQAPSDYPEFAEYIVSLGVDSMSLNPDSIIATRQRIAQLEKTVGKKGNKTHVRALSLVALWGLVGAGLMMLGAGCGSPAAQPVSTVVHDISPAQVRERIEENIEKRYVEERSDERSTLDIQQGVPFSIQYPTGWRVTQWNGGVTIQEPSITQQTTPSQYISLYKELVAPPVMSQATSTVVIDGITGTQMAIINDLGVMQYLIRLVLPSGDIFVIEGQGDLFLSIVESLQFTTDATLITDRPVTHWDQREGRLCAQIITYAQSTQGGSCQAFATPCDVPDGWAVCDASTL